jgi:hypothetical protein
VKTIREWRIDALLLFLHFITRTEARPTKWKVSRVRSRHMLPKAHTNDSIDSEMPVYLVNQDLLEMLPKVRLA